MLQLVNDLATIVADTAVLLAQMQAQEVTLAAAEALLQGIYNGQVQAYNEANLIYADSGCGG